MEVYMKCLVCLAGLLAAVVMAAPTDADAKKAGKSKKSPQVAGFLQVASTGNSGLLPSYERGRRYDRVFGNDNVAKFFFLRSGDGGGT
jgi:hypothetical protein